MSRASSPALIIRFSSDTTAATRDRLVALLADHDLVAIHEDDVTAPRGWTAHFTGPASRDAAAAAIQALEDIEPLEIDVTDVEDGDWARRTQTDLPAVRVGRVIVAPPWDRPDVDGHRLPGADFHATASQSDPGPERSDGQLSGTQSTDLLVVEIEPSRGFGTGHHQSTRLCLVLLQERDITGRTVVDVGTGSGVLAIVAAKLGAAYVSAIDVDPDAVENARENIERNSVANIVEAHVGDLTQSSLAPADLVTANLTGTLLARHADHLAALVRPSGSLIVAGFTVDEKDLVLEAFSGRFGRTESAEEEDWWAFALTRA
ncbi:MAG: 50S ribosomal protein L11 methyltransferase [Vicinamibacterales bacterium]